MVLGGIAYSCNMVMFGKPWKSPLLMMLLAAQDSAHPASRTPLIFHGWILLLLLGLLRLLGLLLLLLLLLHTPISRQSCEAHRRRENEVEASSWFWLNSVLNITTTAWLGECVADFKEVKLAKTIVPWKNISNLLRLKPIFTINHFAQKEESASKRTGWSKPFQPNDQLKRMSVIRVDRLKMLKECDSLDSGELWWPKWWKSRQQKHWQFESWLSIFNPDPGLNMLIIKTAATLTVAAANFSVYVCIILLYQLAQCREDRWSKVFSKETIWLYSDVPGKERCF